MTVPTQTHLWPVKGRDVLEPSEVEFMHAVMQTASLFGWRTIHFRPARTGAGWRTAAEGNAATGFPDCLFLRSETLLAVELKSGGRKPTVEQLAWLEAFSDVPGCRAAVWTTRDPWNQIEEALRTL